MDKEKIHIMSPDAPTRRYILIEFKDLGWREMIWNRVSEEWQDPDGESPGSSDQALRWCELPIPTEETA